MRRHLIVGFVTLAVIFLAGLAFIALEVKINNERIGYLIRNAYPLLNRCNSLSSRIDGVLLDIHRHRLDADKDLSPIIAEVELLERESLSLLSEEALLIPQEMWGRFEREMDTFKKDIHEAVVSQDPKRTDDRLDQASRDAAGLKRVIEEIKARGEAYFTDMSVSIERSLSGSTIALGIVLVASLAFSLVVLSAVVRSVDASLAKFLEVIRHLSEGDFSFRLGSEIGGFPSEFRAIAGSVDLLADRLDVFHKAERDRLSDANRSLSLKNEELAAALVKVQEVSSELQLSKEALARKVEHLEALHRVTEFGLGADPREVMMTFLNIFFPRYGFHGIWIVGMSGEEIGIVASLSRDSRGDEGKLLGKPSENPALPRLFDAGLHMVITVTPPMAQANRALAGKGGATLLCLSVSSTLPLAILAFQPGPRAIPGETVDELATAARTLGLVLENQRLHADLAVRVEEFARSNEELERANRELRSLDEMKDSFISSISHELRTPLAAIKGAVGLVSELFSDPGADAAESGAFLDIATRNCDRLIHLINEILDLSRIQAGRSTVNRRPVPLAEVLGEAAEVVSLLARNKEITVDVEGVGDGYRLWADPTMTQQVFVNLLSNAVKFSREGGRVTVSAAPHSGEGVVGKERLGERQYVLVTVSDRGIGIPEEDLERIFDHFYQVDMTSTRSQGGAGLGLAITRGMVLALGGAVWAESRLGEGSDFRVLLPLARDDDHHAG